MKHLFRIAIIVFGMFVIRLGLTSMFAALAISPHKSFNGLQSLGVLGLAFLRESPFYYLFPILAAAGLSIIFLPKAERLRGGAIALIFYLALKVIFEHVRLV